MDLTRQDIVIPHLQSSIASEDVRKDVMEIELAPDTTAARVLRLNGERNRVLELGCSTGTMSRALRHRGCSVTAIEVNAAAAALAMAHCERVIVGDLDFLDFDAELGDGQFDRIVASDVLQHLKEPVTVLHRLRRFLKPDGVLVVSVPNIAHASVRLSLLTGSFTYAERGALARNNLRFFTRESLLDMLADAGYVVTHLERQLAAVPMVEPSTYSTTVPKEVIETLAADHDAQTFEYVVAATPAGQRNQAAVQDRMTALLTENESLRAQLARVADYDALAAQLQAAAQTKAELQSDLSMNRRRGDAEIKEMRAALTAQAEMIGRLEAELTDQRLVIDEDAAMRRGLHRDLAAAREAAAAATRSEQLLRLEMGELLKFHRAVEGSRGWRFLQILRGFFGRRW